MVVLFVSKFVLDMRSSLDRNRRHLLSTIYHAITRNLRVHRGVSVFHGVVVCGRVFFGEICCLVVSERCVFDILIYKYLYILKYFYNI